ncbi:hypothetical protein SBX64_03765 [Vibrio rhizosphaerae]|uniref:Uncharacterized protein n=1 Tax=Vibrio rhizosphaerae TaxID=398736 RepID=A0ABU4IQJ6_9VIBR|nr:hypothetical protein [Vibrio rhizosphaerae]MDW6091670.1 hypothetical protein [Vibrio rhizosphaerae]
MAIKWVLKFFIFFTISLSYRVVAYTSDSHSGRVKNLMDVLGCDLSLKNDVCLSKIYRGDNESVTIYQFKYKVNVNNDIKDDKKLYDTIDYIMLFYSSQINPLTARYFGENKVPRLLEYIHEDDNEKIVISFKVYLGNKIYTSYLYPIVINNNIRIISRVSEGDFNVYELIEDSCQKSEVIGGEIVF